MKRKVNSQLDVQISMASGTKLYRYHHVTITRSTSKNFPDHRPRSHPSCHCWLNSLPALYTPFGSLGRRGPYLRRPCTDYSGTSPPHQL